jgi:hypothetical protein
MQHIHYAAAAAAAASPDDCEAMYDDEHQYDPKQAPSDEEDDLREHQHPPNDNHQTTTATSESLAFISQPDAILSTLCLPHVLTLKSFSEQLSDGQESADSINRVMQALVKGYVNKVGEIGILRIFSSSCC